MKNHEEIVTFLEQKIPRDEIAQRAGGNGKKLSYLETWKVIDLLNEAFGNLGWDSETAEMWQLEGTEFPTYRAKVRIRAMIQVGDGQFLQVTKEGYGWGADKSKNNAHEMAVKEAESDALKRAAMKFGKRLGLALYDKSQEFVDDEKGTEARTAGSVEVNRVGSVQKDGVPAVSKAFNREVCLKSISQHSKILLDKKAATQDELVAMLKEYGASKKEDLTDDQAKSLLEKLRSKLNG